MIIIFTVIHLLPLIQKKGFVSYKQKYVHKVLVKSLVRLVQGKKMWLGELTISHLDMTTAFDWDLKPNKQTKKNKLYNITMLKIVFLT